MSQDIGSLFAFVECCYKLKGLFILVASFSLCPDSQVGNFWGKKLVKFLTQKLGKYWIFSSANLANFLY
jgi:hypothetical protein